jgi:DNA gyrase subunit A
MGRSSRGVSGVKLGGGDELAGLLRVSPAEGNAPVEQMLILSEYGYGKRVEFSEFSSHGRGTGGQKIYTVTEKTGEISGAVSVLDNEEIMCITSQGKSIKLKVSGIRVMGRSSQGVRILTIDKPDFVIGLDKIVQEDEAADKALTDEAPADGGSPDGGLPDEDGATGSANAVFDEADGAVTDSAVSGESSENSGETDGGQRELF